MNFTLYSELLLCIDTVIWRQSGKTHSRMIMLTDQIHKTKRNDKNVGTD